MNINRETADELQGLFEDALEQFCDKEQISGELAWTILECLGNAKLAEMNGELK